MLTLTLLAASLATASPPEDLDIQASLSGYNLLWPSHRCCAYKLHIYPDGRETIVADISTSGKPGQFKQELTLTSGQLEHIRKALTDADFLHAPPTICCAGIDTDQRQISVRFGDITHSVTIPDGIATDASDVLKQRFRQLMALWNVLTDQVKVPSATVK